MLDSFRQLALAALIVGGVAVGASEAAAEVKDPKPSIVLVHGAFADGSSWDPVVTKLQAKGFTTVAVHQPLTSFSDDVAATRRAIEAQAGGVILVGHSYGGAVITEAGNSSKVLSLVYVAAFGPDAGESINDLGKGKPAPVWAASLQARDGFGSLPIQVVTEHFAQDLSPVEAKLLASKQGPIALANFDAKITTAAWHNRPAYYLLATQDHMIAPEAQAAMAKRMHASVTSLPASHVVMLSKPNDVAKAILAAATAAEPSRVATH